MNESAVAQLLEKLGIDPAYGADPYRPAYDEPDVLVDVEPNVLGRMQRLTPDTAEAWRAMKTAADSAGIRLLLVSGFRSIAYQAELIERKLSAGQTLADVLKTNAAPGFSQHHTGRTIDIATPGARPLTEAFATTAAFDWLAGNAAGFGFRMPYGHGNLAGFGYEPWHWTRLPG